MKRKRRKKNKQINLSRLWISLQRLQRVLKKSRILHFLNFRIPRSL